MSKLDLNTLIYIRTLLRKSIKTIEGDYNRTRKNERLIISDEIDHLVREQRKTLRLCKIKRII